MKEYVATAESENEIAYMNDVADEVEDRVGGKPISCLVSYSCRLYHQS
jgi:hypothetical protein